MRNKEKAFTLVELLAVIVILAIILAIAIPTISGIIGAATRGAFESDAKLLIKAVDYKQLAGVEFDVEQLKKDPDTSEDTVSSILGLPTDNYQEMAFYKDEFGKINVFIIGQNKWANLVAYGTSLNMTIDDSSTYEGGYVCAGTVGDAKATDVLSGKGFTSDGGIQTGTMPNKTGDVTAQSVSRSGTTLKFKPQEGYYLGDAGNNLTYAEPNLVASNIKQGVTIFGLVGSIPDKTGDVTAPSISRSGTTIKFKPQEGYYSGDASNNLTYTDSNFVAGNIKQGVTMFGLAGTLPALSGDVAAQSASTVGTTIKLRPQEGYYAGTSGNNVTYTDPNLVASNIKQGATVLGVTGTFAGKRFASGTTGVMTYNTSTVINVGFPCRFIQVELGKSHNNSTLAYYDNFYATFRYAQTNFGTAYIFPNITYTAGATSFTITTSTYDYSSPSTVSWYAQEF